MIPEETFEEFVRLKEACCVVETRLGADSLTFVLNVVKIGVFWPEDSVCPASK